MLIGKLSESLEDYLETIFRILQKNPVARVRDIAKSQGVKNSSVVSALKRLAQEGLVEYQAREFVDLTESGRQLGFRLYQRHTFLKRFLTDLLQVDNETAEQDACSMEHSISLTTLDRIASMSEFLSYCPDVDADLISNFRDKWLEHLSQDDDTLANGVGKNGDEASRLSELKVGDVGVVARVIAPDEMRRPLVTMGVLPGTSIQVISKSSTGDYKILLAGEKIDIENRQSKYIRIWLNEAKDAVRNITDEFRPKRTLADITPGNSFKIVKISIGGEIRQRILDMGFIKGATGRVMREALLRDPIELELGNALLSLRRVEAAGIMVEEIDA
jgi:DtxR family transcriptional regulator, Mn-dependent transcriptional regulator